MALRVDLRRETLEEALSKAIASTNRAINSTKQLVIKEAYQRELKELQTALNTITEIK